MEFHSRLESVLCQKQEQIIYLSFSLQMFSQQVIIRQFLDRIESENPTPPYSWTVSLAEAIKMFHTNHIVTLTKESRAKRKWENSHQYLKPAQKDRLVYEHLQCNFKIITSDLKNYFERIHTEAYFIKTQQLSLNIQQNENFFELYS